LDKVIQKEAAQFLLQPQYTDSFQKGNPKGSCPVPLTTAIHWQLSEHLWRGYYKCTSKLR